MPAWLAARARSEVLVVGVAVLVVAGALYFLFVIEPLHTANARLHNRVGAQIDLQRHLIGIRDEVTRLGTRVGTHADFPAGGSLLSVVTNTARDAGIQPSTRKMTPINEDALGLLLEDVAFNTLTAWLLALDRAQGVEVERISIDAGGTPGVVSAQMILKTRRPSR